MTRKYRFIPPYKAQPGLVGPVVVVMTGWGRGNLQALRWEIGIGGVGYGVLGWWCWPEGGGRGSPATSCPTCLLSNVIHLLSNRAETLPTGVSLATGKILATMGLT